MKIQNVIVCVGRYQCTGQIHTADRTVPSSAILLTLTWGSMNPGGK